VNIFETPREGGDRSHSGKKAKRKGHGKQTSGRRNKAFSAPKTLKCRPEHQYSKKTHRGEEKETRQNKTWGWVSARRVQKGRIRFQNHKFEKRMVEYSEKVQLTHQYKEGKEGKLRTLAKKVKRAKQRRKQELKLTSSKGLYKQKTRHRS